MSRDARRLIDWNIPVAKHSYTRRDTAFYALSLGVGRDPLDRRALALVDPWHSGLKALPTLALVLGYPGFWLGEREVEQASGVSPTQILHAEQAVTLAAPLPVEGEVSGHTRVTALVDKGVGRGALLYSERRIIDERTGSLLATCSQVHYLRGAGGCGTVGQAPGRANASVDEPTSQIEVPTLSQQALLYRLNGDANPLHSDPDAASIAGFERPILHGMCTTGMAVAAVISELAQGDPDRVRALSVRMTSPVMPGESLQIEISRDGGFRARIPSRSVTVLDCGRVYLEGV